ncbi:MULTISPECIES: GerMN domain-containing protein [Desulfitobacterium]|uniref:Spore germination protein n=1 Tax=Desulfitobacterium dehalogenans (strain ATCC 51507 / DSM 9161 / JW/IU-DC1) TaxID=756499 RepID=I4AD20_DESDJ|nr:MULTISPECIES: GerMN domain-containing protein [Desulfitobacterium]AFM01855.1 spore germination protein [Desulfitobacterium dehalogenans ATCC 51507]
MCNAKFRSLIIAFSIFFLTFGLVGCGSDDTTKNTPPSPPPANVTDPQNPDPVEPAPTETVEVTMYFPTSDATGLVPTDRTVNVAKKSSEEVIAEMFKEFANPPSGLVAPLPKETKLLDVKIKDGVATINLSNSFRENFEGGATGEQMVLYSIVNSLTTLKDVDSVEFLLEGELKAAILGGLDTSTPVTANESLILK